MSRRHDLLLALRGCSLSAVVRYRGVVDIRAHACLESFLIGAGGRVEAVQVKAQEFISY